MAQLRAGGVSLAAIGRRYGMTRQAVHSRLKRSGLIFAGPPIPRSKAPEIGRDRLEKLYTENVLSVDKIGVVFGVGGSVIRRALIFYQIPKRLPIKRSGKYADVLRKLAVGESAVIESAIKYPSHTFHLSAKSAGIKITTRTTGPGTYRLTRIV